MSEQIEIKYVSDARDYPEYEAIIHELESDLWKFTTSREEIENIRILKEEGEDECNEHFSALRAKYFEKELKRRGHLVELGEWSDQYKERYTLLLNIPN
jgi:hypothetical protein